MAKEEGKRGGRGGRRTDGEGENGEKKEEEEKGKKERNARSQAQLYHVRFLSLPASDSNHTYSLGHFFTLRSSR